MKNFKLQGILLYFSLILLFIIAIIAANSDSNSLLMTIMSVIVVLIPAIYSAVPLFDNYKIEKNRQKNYLSQDTFTDRKDDVKHIMQKLITAEHIIEITGNDKQCGKTWIAMKIVDYINHPKDYKEKKFKLPYKAAYYFDLNKCNNDFINDFLEKYTINSKTVLIFDHVDDIDYILSKQSLYHFQLIYIMHDKHDYNFFKYNISNFEESNINELQNKIRYNYSGIDCISEQEIQILYKLTDGNIGKIHSMLSSQKCVQWIKNIVMGTKTDYDEALNKIKIELLVGEYRSAEQKLKEFEVANKQYFNNNNILYYNYILIKSDCEHLLNHYQDAIALLSIIEQPPYVSNNKNYELELYKAHYYKHLWKCNDALEILNKISLATYSAKVDALGILAAKYFIDDLHVPYNTNTSLTEFFDIYCNAYNHISDATPSDALKCQRCTAIYLYYKDMSSDLEKLVLKITEVIDKYKSEHDRLLANAYFVRGELYRIYGQYEKAAEDYARATAITYDNNIIVQTNLIVFYLKQCKKVNMEFNSLSENEIINLCTKNNYAKLVFQRIKSIYLNDPNKEHIIDCFDNRIMPIL